MSRTCPSPYGTLPARFAAKVHRSPETECWRWTGSLSTSGYGKLKIGRGEWKQAHRISWEMHRGPIPDGLEIDHLCRNRACVNPDHLEPVTHAENQRRSPISPAGRNAAKTTCIRGHELAGANLRLTTRGTRVCRECEKARQRRAAASGRAAA